MVKCVELANSRKSRMRRANASSQRPHVPRLACDNSLPSHSSPVPFPGPILSRPVQSSTSRRHETLFPSTQVHLIPFSARGTTVLHHRLVNFPALRFTAGAIAGGRRRGCPPSHHHLFKPLRGSHAEHALILLFLTTVMSMPPFHRPGPCGCPPMRVCAECSIV